jgi:hypothetical protein
MVLKAITLFLMIIVRPDNSIEKDFAILESCPPPNYVFPALREELQAGKIKGFYANCFNVNLVVKEEEPS